jgi:DHA2 family multidrug resistance protein-like MFS transporter
MKGRSGMDESGRPSSAGRRELIGLAVLALPTLLLSLDMSVLYLALPKLTADLGAGATQQLWIIDIYGFMIAGFLVTMGTLGDRIGRRRLLLIGAAAFGLTSVAAAYATSPAMLIGARAALGIAGATLMPSTLALINNMFRDPRQRATAIGGWMSCFLGGVAVGPVIGGALLERFWWGSVFLVGVPVMALLVVCAPFLLPEYRDDGAGRPDLVSVVMSLAAILPIIYGLKEIAKNGLAPVPGATAVAGAAVGVLFVRRQRRLDDPLLDVRLFGDRTFTAALSFMLLGGIMAGYNFLVALHLQEVEGFSPLRAGLWLVPPTLAAIVSSLLAPLIARRVRPGHVIALGMVIAAAGLFLITQVDRTGGLAVLMTGLVVTFAGAGPLGALSTDLVVGSAPPEKSGSAAAMSETSGEFGIAFGVALVGSIATAVYRGRLGGHLTGVPHGAAATAREGIVGATSAAAHLPARVGAELTRRAGDAFTAGLHVAAAVSGAAALVLAVVAAVLLRHVPPYGEGADDDADDKAPDMAYSR